MFSHITSSFFRYSMIGFVSLFLSACSDNTGDLTAWVEQIRAKPAGPIKTMPDIKEYRPHEYSSGHLRSPFAEMEPQLEAQLQALHDGCDDSIRPDASRRKQDLERFSLDSMEMVGLIENNKQLWGLIQMTAGPDKGNVYYVTTDTYLGLNHGRIMSINEQQIEISTLIPDNKGCWEKRTIYMALAQ